MIVSGGRTQTTDTRWADPGYFRPGSRLRNWLRILIQLFKPPRGHRTLPTTAGWLLILIALGVGSAAFNTGNNILYVGLALLLGSLLLSGVLSWMNFKGCRWRLRGPTRIRAGSPCHLAIEVANDKKFMPSWALQFLVTHDDSNPHQAVWLSQGLDARTTTQLPWQWVPQKRGKYTITLRGIVSEYPFGFFAQNHSRFTQNGGSRLAAVNPDTIRNKGSIALTSGPPTQQDRRRP
ncbi:MAG: hypothetical protein LR015_05895 [Verrucomicrobia bacterium]|nr:hypothetical protein [Verrucomicrobiota bacterium]